MQTLTTTAGRHALLAAAFLSLLATTNTFGQTPAEPAAASSASPTAAPALTATRSTITGRVSDAASKARMGAVIVEIVGTNLRTSTNRDGEFILRYAPAGTQTIEFRYLGYATKSETITIDPTQPTRLEIQLLTASAAASDDTVTQMDTYRVHATRDGQARALNQQRVTQNIANIVSSDFAGQFPDKTIADAVKRMPGVTVETDPDTGGSEGRYITVRGMSAAFNAVSINGVRVAIGNADDTNSRQVPLDVISAKSADMIVITKALRPDQDGDSIGGAVDIYTRSPLDHEGPTAYVEGAISYRDMLRNYSGDYRFKNPGYEGALSYGATIDAARKWAFVISANARQFTSQKQRVSTYDWLNIAPSDYDWTNVDQIAPANTDPLFAAESLILQDFFDHVTTGGASLGVDFRPNTNHNFRLNLAYNIRDTNRGRQRQEIWYDDEGEISPDATVSGDTVTSFTTPYNSFWRTVRDFYE